MEILPRSSSHTQGDRFSLDTVLKCDRYFDGGTIVL